MEEKRDFNKGDFIAKTNKQGWFAIYEGCEIRNSYYLKKYTLICAYDPSAYGKQDDGTYGSYQKFVYATSAHPCDETVDENKESYFYRLATEDEIEAAKKILEEQGFYWNPVEYTLTDLNSGEVVKKIVGPKTKYSGNVIKPTRGVLEAMHKKAMESVAKPSAVQIPIVYRNDGYDGWD